MVHENKSESSESLLNASDENVENIWYLDSGASRHMTGTKIMEVDHGQITIGDAKSYKIQSIYWRNCF